MNTQVRLLRACIRVKELSRLTASDATSASNFILNAFDSWKKHSGINIQIAVRTHTFARTALLFSTTDKRYCGCMASVRRVAKHCHNAIKN